MTRAATSLLLLLLAAACNGGPSAAELARLDRERADATDPAITAALEDPIMTDRDLSVADHSRRVRYVPGPAEASTPARITANAAVYNALKALETPPPACHRGFQTGPDWAARMPAPFAPPAGATLVEASGNTARGCAAVVAVYRVTLSARRVVAAMRAGALAAGYASTLQLRGADRVLSGRRPRDGATYYLVASPRSDGSEIAVRVAAG
ncbi:MAG TPA: hypothetical protein VEZ48_10735 [Sphingomonadaceae bacterium]|nr:hypothetical protein [Sphingomonadaceae bacterium]